VAWRICRNIITHALDYDSRVLTSSLVLPHAAAVERRAWDVVEAVVGRSLTGSERLQLQLPTDHAGCQMPMPTAMVPVARAADLIEVGVPLRQAIVGWGIDLVTAASVDGVDDAVAEGLLMMLADRGIGFDGPGHPAQLRVETEADMENYDFTAAALRPAALQKHSMSGMLRIAALASYEEQFQAAGERSSTRLLSAGGPNAGKSLTAPAGLKTTHFADEEFTEIVRWRLGLAPEAEPTLCQNAIAKGKVCEETMNEFLDHAMCCSNGPLRIRRHEDIANCLADMIDDTGAHVRREAYMKVFSTAESAAWLDIWAFAGMHLPELIIDVTVRHPVVQRYQPNASVHAGAAAAEAEKDKQSRYPPASGRSVSAFAVETWGRLRQTAEEMLTNLAAEATRHARRRGQAVTAGAYLRKWRASLDACLQRGVAAALLAARCSLAGKPHHRHR